ncbi:MAG: TlyA family RNA methyltransferase [Deltaproteobacteria bacterium]|nr:TlyA family RNA methyltransferase [Deltaproteobacteria bacterium]
MKTRLDQLLIEKKYALNIESARAIIGAGEVLVDEVVADKPGQLICTDALLRVKVKCPFVSRGGLKLEKGLSFFQIAPAGKICIDIGASSGGFTDCLLKHDAAKVYAVDVAYGQLAWKIRQDKRVVVFERFNARKITRADISENIDLAVIDASFISITKLIPPLLPLFDETVSILALIKPQFELPRDQIEPGGVVRDAGLHLDSIKRIENFIELSGLTSKGVTESPLLGPKGNKEFLILITDR